MGVWSKCGGSTNLFEGMTHLVVKIFVLRMLQYQVSVRYTVRYIHISVSQPTTSKTETKKAHATIGKENKWKISHERKENRSQHRHINTHDRFWARSSGTARNRRPTLSTCARRPS